jgi:hypothetical protein
MYATEHGKMMVRLWTLSIFSCSPNKPPLVLTGPAECGKTAVARCIASLIGLMPTTANVTEKGEDAFWTLIDQGGIATLDNVDTSIKWFVPAMETASTGGMNAKKKLYTDSDIILQRTNTWPIITSLNPSFAASQALSSRIIIVRLTPPEEADRTNLESALTDEITVRRSAAMSYIARAIARILQDQAHAPNNINKRHPDWGGWAWRAGRAIGHEQIATESLQQAESDKAFLNLESSWIGEMLIKVIDKEEFKGSATDLIKLFESKIEGWDGIDPIDRKGKKLTPTKVGKRLEAVWRSLAHIFKATKKDHSGTAIYTFKPPSMWGVEATFQKSANTDVNNTVFSKNTSSTSHIVGGEEIKEGEGGVGDGDEDWRDLI